MKILELILKIYEKYLLTPERRGEFGLLMAEGNIRFKKYESEGRREHLEQAVRNFAKAAGLNGTKQEKAEAYFKLGKCYEYMDSVNDAINAWRDCIRCNKRHPEVWLRLAGMLYQKGDLEEAWAALEKHLKIRPNDPPALDLLKILGRGR